MRQRLGIPQICLVVITVITHLFVHTAEAVRCYSCATSDLHDVGFFTHMQSTDRPIFIGDECCGGSENEAHLPTVECADYCVYGSMRMFAPANIKDTMTWGVWRGCHAHIQWQPVASSNVSGVNCYTSQAIEQVDVTKVEEEQARIEEDKEMLAILSGVVDKVEPTDTTDIEPTETVDAVAVELEELENEEEIMVVGAGKGETATEEVVKPSESNEDSPPVKPTETVQQIAKPQPKPTPIVSKPKPKPKYPRPAGRVGPWNSEIALREIWAEQHQQQHSGRVRRNLREAGIMGYQQPMIKQIIQMCTCADDSCVGGLSLQLACRMMLTPEVQPKLPELGGTTHKVENGVVVEMEEIWEETKPEPYKPETKPVEPSWQFPTENEHHPDKLVVNIPVHRPIMVTHEVVPVVPVVTVAPKAPVVPEEPVLRPIHVYQTPSKPKVESKPTISNETPKKPIAKQPRPLQGGKDMAEASTPSSAPLVTVGWIHIMVTMVVMVRLGM